MTIGFVCGLKREAETLPADVMSRCEGPGYEAAETACRWLLSQGASALVSFGTAGGLDPTLEPGVLLVPHRIIQKGRFSSEEAEEWCVDPTLRAQLPQGRGGILLGSHNPVTGVYDKARLYAETGALGVDMESHAVARVAGETGVPFAVIRAVVDPAHRAIPEWATQGIDKTGKTRILPILKAMVLSPSRIRDLRGLANDSRKAMKILEDAGKKLQSLV